MRLRSRDTEYYDETKRTAGLAAFLKNVEGFLSDRVEGDGDGWSPVSEEDEGQLHEFFKEIIALKWGTDADGDLPINFAIVDRNTGTLSDFYVPYEPDVAKLKEKGLSDDEIAEKEELYWMELARTAGHMASSAQELMRRFDRHYGDLLTQRMEKRSRDELLAKTLETINGRADESTYEEDRDRVIFLSKPKGYDSKSKDAGKFNNHPEAQAALQAAMTAKYPERLARAIEDVAKLMAPFEDDDSDGYYNEVTKPRLEFVRVFGDAFSNHPQIGPVAQDQFQKGKAKRTARRAAAAAAKQA